MREVAAPQELRRAGRRSHGHLALAVVSRLVQPGPRSGAGLAGSVGVDARRVASPQRRPDRWEVGLVRVASVIGDVVYFSTLAKVPAQGRTFGLDARTGRRVLTFPDGRYSPAVGIDGLIVMTGVRTLYGLVPR